MRTRNNKRQTAPLKFEAIIVCLLVVTLVGCDRKPKYGVEYFRLQAHISSPAEYQQCAGMVNQYIATQKAWPESDYNVSFDGLDHETGYQVFRITHIETYRRPIETGGNGYSVFIRADCANLVVKGEYRQQQ